MPRAEIGILVGKILSKVEGVVGGEEVIFTADDGSLYRLFHAQDCCESVYIDDVVGDLDDLIGSPLLMAEEETNSDIPRDTCDESFTWTFYKFATIKGYVTVKWYGTSNGYYSESVDFQAAPFDSLNWV